MKKILYDLAEGARRALKQPPEIRTYFGLTGSGKTTAAVAMMHKIHKKHKKRIEAGKVNIYSNIDSNLGYVKRITKDDVTDGQLHDGYVFYDEASLDYNNRDFKKFSRESQNFFRYHRKNELSVYVFSQSPDDTDKVIRELSHRLYRIERLGLLVFVRPIKRRIGVDPMSKDLKTVFELSPFYSFKWYFWPRWSFKFDSFKRTNKHEEKGQGTQPEATEAL